MAVLRSWCLNLLYVAMLALGWLWMLWRYVHGKSRRGWAQKLFGFVDPSKSNAAPNSNGPQEAIWIHAVSVGEVHLLGPILQEFHKCNPKLKIAISTATETGYDLAMTRYPGHYVFFCPFDFTWAIKRVLKRLNPSALILTELELWPNLIATADRMNVPVIVANGRLSEKSAKGYRRMSWLLKSSFKQLSLVLCQSQAYADRFVSLGCEHSDVYVTGNVKFDGIESDRGNAKTKKLVQLSRINSAEKVFLAGSTQLEEDLLAAQAYLDLAPEHPELRLVLAPRHPRRVGELVNRLRKLGVESQLRSELGCEDVTGPNDERSETIEPQNDFCNSPKPVLIIDVIGELGAWWGRADIAYVGGSMGAREGQNMIEPAAYGTPVSFGPRTKNFNDLVAELQDNNAATVVKDDLELSEFVSNCLTDPGTASQAGRRARQVVLNHAGASARTVDAILGLTHGAAGQIQTRKPNISDAA